MGGDSSSSWYLSLACPSSEHLEAPQAPAIPCFDLWVSDSQLDCGPEEGRNHKASCLAHTPQRETSFPLLCDLRGQAEDLKLAAASMARQHLSSVLLGPLLLTRHLRDAILELEICEVPGMREEGVAWL